MKKIEVITVIGSGTMGHGIAQVAALAGYQVFLHDIEEDLLEKAMARIRETLDQGVRRGKVTEEQREIALGNLQTTEDLAAAVETAGLVIEAIVEDLAVKQELFTQLDQQCSSDAILASNTSSLSITEIARATKRPGKVLGMHFFNPVHLMKLVEIVRGEHTTDKCVETAEIIAEKMGKACIVVKDSPGFATSRLGVVIGLEAMRMLEQGVASAEDIDKAMELGYNHPMGPLRLSDIVGLDVRLSIAEYLYSKLGTEQFKPPEILRRMVAEGKLGKKSSEGFYKW